MTSLFLPVLLVSLVMNLHPAGQEDDGLNLGRLAWGMSEHEVETLAGEMPVERRCLGHSVNVNFRYMKILSGKDVGGAAGRFACRESGLSAIEYSFEVLSDEALEAILRSLDRKWGKHSAGYAFHSLAYSVCLAPPGRSQWDFKGLKGLIKEIMRSRTVKTWDLKTTPDLAPEVAESFKEQLEYFFEVLPMWRSGDSVMLFSRKRQSLIFIDRRHFEECRKGFLGFVESSP